MPIADDWNFDYANKVISHIDGILSYDGGTGTQPSVGDYIIGATSGALGKVLARTGTVTSGTLTLTNVVGLFQNNEVLDTLSVMAFDGIANGGFKVGDTITDQVTGSMDVKFIEYNIDGVAGHGSAFGNAMTVFTNNSALDVTGGASAVGLADGTGTDNDTIFDALVNLTLGVPGTANTNDSVIIHYDAGTIDIPEDAHIQSAVSTAEGYAQRIYGETATGSVRVIDSDTTGGAWTDGQALRVLDVEHYDTLVAGKVFAAGDVIKGATSLYEARILAVIVDTSTTGRLILGGNTGTPWTDTEDIQVLQADDTYVTYANVETGQNSYEDVATIKLDVAVRDVQRADQGGIFGSDDPSLNIVRSFNAFYSLNMDNFDELAQLDDDPAMDGDVRDQLYTILNNYVIPDLSFRFLEKGAAKDTANNNLFVNLQSAGVLADVGNWGFEPSTTNPTPRPDMYVEQDGLVSRQDWLEGPVDILVKVKTSTDPQYIDPAVEALGQLINGGVITLHVRPYRRTYDSSEIVAPAGGQQAIFLSNAADLNNTTAQYSATQTGGSGTFVIGEEATTPAGKRVVMMNAATGGAGSVEWANKVDGSNLVTSDVITGVVSGATSTINTVSNLVAGYGTDIRVMVVQRKFTESVAPSTAFILGEVVTQTGTGATGYFMEYESGTGDVYIEEESGTFNGTGVLTGGTSGCTYTPATGAAWGSVSSSEFVPKDIGGGVGDKNYLAVVSADITDASPQTVQFVYEWWKFNIARESSTYEVNTPGGLFSAFTQGRIYRRLDTTFAETRGASAFGLKAGTLVIGAQGVYIERLTLAIADIRSIQLIDVIGGTYDPPNVQTMETIGLTTGVAVATYRSDGAASLVILRNEFDVGAVGGGNNQSADSTILIGDGTRTGVPTPNDVPDTGVLRILDPNDTGNYLRFPYSSVDRSTGIFTLASGNIGDVTGAQDLVLDDNVHCVFYEEVSGGASVNKAVQYVSDIDLVAVARVKGKKPFKAAAVFVNTGVSIGAVLADDNVVNLP